MAKEEMAEVLVVFNRGQRVYYTSKGSLHPGKSHELPAKEAKDLLDYHDIVDFAKVAPEESNRIADLKAENAKLKKELEESQVAETKVEEKKKAEPEKKHPAPEKEIQHKRKK
jgi:hypothetical protein